MKYIYRIFLLLIMASCGRMEKTVKLDAAGADSLVKVIRTTIGNHIHQNRAADAIEYLDSIRPTINEMNNSTVTSAWLSYKGAAFVADENKDSARFYLDKAISVASEDTSKGASLVPKIQMVTFLVQQQVYDTALQHALEAYQLAKTAAAPELPLLYSQLAFLYKMTGDPESQRNYLFDGLNISKEPHHILVLASDIKKYYVEQNQIDSAIYFYNHYLALNNSSIPYLMAWKYDDLGSLLLSQNRPLEALNNLLMAVRLYKKFGKISEGIYFSIATACEQLHRSGARDLYLDTATEIARQHGNLVLLSKIFSKKAGIKLAQHQYNDAYQALDSSHYYHQQDDSLYIDRARNIEAKITRKAKDDQIAAMAFEVQAGRKIIQQRQFIIVVLILGALLLMAFGIMLFRRRQMQLKLRESNLQQQLLRNQMEPHFVFNSLSVLQCFIRHDKAEKSINYLSNFSRLLRLNLENGRHSFVPLVDELAALNSYLSLQVMNFENMFEYEVKIENSSEVENILVPPMLLQPFVENAILHGFNNTTDKGVLKIEIQKKNYTLHCIIEDNGVGLQSNNGQPKRSLSTVITKERLALLTKQTGKPAQVTIIDKHTAGKGKGVKVILDIPFRLVAEAKDK